MKLRIGGCVPRRLELAKQACWLKRGPFAGARGFLYEEREDYTGIDALTKIRVRCSRLLGAVFWIVFMEACEMLARKARGLLAAMVLASIFVAPHTQAFAAGERAGPEYPRAITGRVTVGKDHPLAGVLVEWGYFSDELHERESVETDADGRYRLETSRVGRDFRLGFSKAGFAPQWFDRFVPGPASRPSEVNVTLQRGTEITVQFVTDAGQPVAGLEVTPYTPSNGFHSSFSSPTPSTPLPGRNRTVPTDESGRVTLVDLPAKPIAGTTEAQTNWQRSRNWLQVTATRDRKWLHETQFTESAILSGEPLEVKASDRLLLGVAADGVLRGRVIDRSTRQSVAEFHVMRRYGDRPHAIQNANGEFTIGGSLVNGQQYETRVFAPGYAVGVANVPADSRGKAVRLTIELSPHPSLEGRMVDAATDRPLANVQIVAGAAPATGLKYIEWGSLDRYADGYHSLHNVLRVTTDKDGQFIVPEAPGAAATLLILTPGYERRVISPAQRPAADGEGIVTIALAPAASVTAIADRETPFGRAARSVWLTCQTDDDFEHMNWSLPFNEDGECRINSLRAGKYRLTLYFNAGNMSFPCYSKALTLEAGEHKNVRLGQMPGNLRLDGHAGPFNVVTISPKSDSDIGSFAVQADVDGRFELAGLLPGEYSITLDASSSSAGYHSDMPSRMILLTEDMEVDLAAPLAK
jgi:hypothetical protein